MGHTKKILLKSKIFAAIILMLVSALPTSVYANSQFYSLNDILFYDENASGCAPGDSGNTSTALAFDTSKLALYEAQKGQADPGAEWVRTQAGHDYAVNTLKIPESSIKIYEKSYMQAMMMVEVAKQYGQLSDKHGTTLAQAQQAVLSYQEHEDLRFQLFVANKDAGSNLMPSYTHSTLAEADETLNILSLTYYQFRDGAAGGQNKRAAASFDPSYAMYLGVKAMMYYFTSQDGTRTGEERWKQTLGLIFLPSKPTQYWQDPLAKKYWDDYAGFVVQSTTAPTGASTSAQQRLETILNFLTGKGLSLAAAAGIAGNLKSETASTFDPLILQGGKIASSESEIKASQGFGIAQWTTAGRQANLIAYAHSSSKTALDLDVQLGFLWEEANSSYKEMMVALNSIKSGIPYNTVDPALAAAIIFHGATTLITSANNAFVMAVNPPTGFESSARSADSVVNNRGGAATTIYNTYKGQIADGGGASGVGTKSTGATGGGCENLSAPAVQNGDIVKTALLFAHDAPVPDGTTLESQAKPEFVEAIKQYNPGASVADCGMFVGTVMRASGVDPGYPGSSTSTQLDYVKKSTSKYQIIESPKRTDLAPGDILIVNNTSVGSDSHHTEIYTGNSPYPIADAALNERVPSVRSEGALTWMLSQTGVIAARVIK